MKRAEDRRNRSTHSKINNDKKIVLMGLTLSCSTKHPKQILPTAMRGGIQCTCEALLVDLTHATAHADWL